MSVAQEWRAASSRVGALKKLVARADALAEEAEIEAAAAADEGEEPGVEEARERSTQAQAAKADAEASRDAALREVRGRYLSDESGTGGTLPGLVQECQRCQETTAAAKVASRRAIEAAEVLSVALEASEAGQAQRAAQRHRHESDRVRGLLQEAELKVANIDAEIAEEEAEQFAAEAAAEQEYGEAAWAGWEEDEEAERAEEDRMACDFQDGMGAAAGDSDAEMMEEVEVRAATHAPVREGGVAERRAAARPVGRTATSEAAATDDVTGATRELRTKEYTAAQLLAMKGRAWFSDAFLRRTTLGVTIVYEQDTSGAWHAGCTRLQSQPCCGVSGSRASAGCTHWCAGAVEVRCGRQDQRRQMSARHADVHRVHIYVACIRAFQKLLPASSKESASTSTACCRAWCFAASSTC